jgi:antitoxin HicB
MEFLYPAMIEAQEPSGFFVRFVDFDDTFTEGASEEEALFNAAEVLSGMLAWRLDSGLEIPSPSRRVKGAHYIAPDAKTQAALLVRAARGERSIAELARALETSWPAAQRLEDPHHWPSLRQLERAAAAVGKRLVLTFE